MEKNVKPSLASRFSDSKFITLFYFVFFYAFILLYLRLVSTTSTSWAVNEATYTHHLVDYSFGFCTKFLAGAIYHIFFKEVIPEQLNVYLTVLTLLFFAALSFLLARAMGLKEKSGDRKALLLIFVIYLTGPCTFSMYVRQFGMLDFYWLLFAAVFFFVVDKKYLKFIAPLIYAATLLVHFSSIVVFILLYSLVLLYEASSNESKGERVKYYIVLAVSILVAAGLFLYFLLNEKSNLVYGLADFDKEILKRNRFGEAKAGAYYIYFRYALYDFFDRNGDGVNDFAYYPLEHFSPALAKLLPSGLGAVIAKVLSQLTFNRAISQDADLVLFGNMLGSLFVLPVLVFIYAFFIHMLKKSRGVKRLVFLLAMLQFPITLGVGMLSSVDFGRWVSHAFLMAFTLMVYVIIREKEQLEWVKLKIKRISVWAILLYLPIYMCAQIVAYS